MTNPAGRYFENRVISYLCGIFPKMERRRQHGRFDKGEFINTGTWALECKNTKTINWSAALNEAEQEARHAGVPWHAAIINRRNHALDKAYVVMTLRQFADLLRHVAHLEAEEDGPDTAA
jgi:hypothetical protein